jgi:hypothetical protein
MFAVGVQTILGQFIGIIIVIAVMVNSPAVYQCIKRFITFPIISDHCCPNV